MQTSATVAVTRRTAFEVVIIVPVIVLSGYFVAQAPDLAPEAKAAAAIVEGVAKAPIPTATLIVKAADGLVRVRTLFIRLEISSRQSRRPRAKRCFTASSVIPSVSATA